MSADFAALLRVLATGGVDFIIVGGVAAAIHGAARATYDVDVVYARTADNMARLVAALAPLKPYLRGAPPGLPFSWDVETLEKGLNFTLTTTAGDLDLLGEVTYGGTYNRLLPDADIVSVLGIECRCLSHTAPSVNIDEPDQPRQPECSAWSSRGTGRSAARRISARISSILRVAGIAGPPGFTRRQQ